MTAGAHDRLYELLPRVYRGRDEVAGAPLCALMTILEEEFARLEYDVEALYDNWFIETADEWVVPYFAELIGLRGLDGRGRELEIPRRLVANMLAYRRRQGTPAVLENVVRDATGWPCLVAEPARGLAIGQHVGGVRTARGRTVDVRDRLALHEISGPFGTTGHSVDPSRPRGGARAVDDASRRGRVHHPAVVRVFLWRLNAYPVSRSRGMIAERPAPPGCFHVDPLRRDVRLFRPPLLAPSVGERSGERAHLPLPMTRVRLTAELADVKASRDDPTRPTRHFESYGPGRSLNILVRRGDVNEAKWEAVHGDRIVSADLSAWAPRSASPAGDEPVLVDVERGRIRFMTDPPPGPRDVLIDYAYGFSGDIGGGPYARRIWSSVIPDPATEAHVGAGAAYATIDEALQAREDALRLLVKQAAASNEAYPASKFTIRIIDSDVHTLGDRPIDLPPGADLTITAGDGSRPVVAAPHGLVVRTAEDDGGRGGIRRFTLEGLLLDGPLVLPSVRSGPLEIMVSDCTVLPPDPQHGSAAIVARAGARAGARSGAQADHGDGTEAVGPLSVSIDRSITGPIRLPDAALLTVRDSIVDGGDAPDGVAIGAPAIESTNGPAVDLERVTVLGAVHASTIRAEDALLTEAVLVLNGERGANVISFSYVHSSSSRALRLESCQPALAVERAAEQRNVHPDDLSAAVRAEVEHGVHPVFTSRRWGEPGYGQLSARTSIDVRHGGTRGGEPGAFHHLRQPARTLRLRAALEEFLPVGLESSVQFMT